MKKQIIAILAFFVTIMTFAQKEEIRQGDWKNLEGISQYSVVFDYSGCKVNRYKTEEEFINDVEERFNNVGYHKFDLETWIGLREKSYEPKFIHSFNKRFDDNKVVIDKDNVNADYVMKVHTTHIVTGFTNGTINKASKVDAVISIYRKNDPDTILFEVKYIRAQGNNGIPVAITPGHTVAESYAKVAKTFAKRVLRKVF